MSLTGDFLSNQTQVTEVTLANLNLTGNADGLAELLPSSMLYLSLVNVLIDEFPESLAGLPNLNAMYEGSELLDPRLRSYLILTCLVRSSGDLPQDNVPQLHCASRGARVGKQF